MLDPQPLSAADLPPHLATYPDPADLAEWQTPPGPLECADCGTAWPCREVLLSQVRILEAERDDAMAALDIAVRDAGRIVDALVVAAARAERLVALEAAARRSVAANRDGATGDLVAADRALEQAVAALPAAPGGEG